MDSETYNCQRSAQAQRFTGSVYRHLAKVAVKGSVKKTDLELAQDLQTSPVTVRRHLKRLSHHGYIAIEVERHAPRGVGGRWVNDRTISLLRDPNEAAVNELRAVLSLWQKAATASKEDVVAIFESILVGKDKCSEGEANVAAWVLTEFFEGSK